ncbi:hypothetical protein [Wohlfahrtiimonas chitiniclastica]|uniref:hypothetical protein n=1 Tax=Wohlfahrtiimonas chitiniclastica TaxID=400946 RepID=UPI0003672683|nr:hypothetical protein [Wohlfahrtiimonas chitiniclastica]
MTVSEVMADVSAAKTITTTPYEKQRKQLTIAFFICGLFLVGLIVFAFMRLPKYESNQDVAHLSTVYDAVRDIDHYIDIQAQGGHIEEAFLKARMQTISENLQKVEGIDANNVLNIWQNFQQQLAEQNNALNVVNNAIRLKQRADAASQSLYQDLSGVSSQLSDARSVSLETIRYIDQLANAVVRLHANLTRVINSQAKVDIQTISELTDSLSVVQKGLNVLMMGSPQEGVQSIRGSLEEESILEAQFVFNQLARDVSSLIKDARGLVLLNQMRTKLQDEKDTIQRLLQTTIDTAYEGQQAYIQSMNQYVRLISLIVAGGIVLFFLIFAFLFLRLNRARLSILFEKDVKDQRIVQVMAVVDHFVTLRERLMTQLDLVASLNNESDRILAKGREVRESSHSISDIIKEMQNTYDYLEQAFSHDLSLVKKGGDEHLETLRSTLKKQLAYFTERKDKIADVKQTAWMIEAFFSSVVSNTNDSVVAYREVEQELMLIISEIDQLNRGLKEEA